VEIFQLYKKLIRIDLIFVFLLLSHCQAMICVSFTVTLCYVVNTLLAIARYVPCVYLHWIDSDDILDFHRNKSIFRLISTHEEEFGVQARWNYLESGHGKGLCDGLGTSVKRSADNAIKHGYVPCVYLHWIDSDDIMDFEGSLDGLYQCFSI
jgi:hypothetical protein